MALALEEIGAIQSGGANADADAISPWRRWRFHFIHGAADPVILPSFSEEAAQRLRELDADATLEVLPGLGHGIDMRVAKLLAGYFQLALPSNSPD